MPTRPPAVKRTALEKWMKEVGHTPATLASKVGCGRTMVIALISGERNAGPKLAAKLVRLTNMQGAYFLAPANALRSLTPKSTEAA